MRLRRLRPDDAVGVHAVAASGLPFVPGAPADPVLADAQRHVGELLEEAAAGYLVRAIDDEGYIGNVVVRPPRGARGLPTTADLGRLPELGFSLHADRRREGIMAAMLPRALEEAPWPAIEARCHADNAPSFRLLAGNGFVQVGADGPWLHWRRERPG